MRPAPAGSLRSVYRLLTPLTPIVVAALMLLPAAAGADWIVTRTGEQIETDGTWRLAGEEVRFTAADGTAATLPVEEVDLEASRQASEAKITLYMTSWCPYCRKAQELLDELEVPYIARDIEEDPEALAEFRARGDGGSGIPLIDFDGEVLRGFHAEKIRRLAARVEGRGR